MLSCYRHYMKMNMEKLLFISCSCLLASVVLARGGPKEGLGPLSDDENATRTCADVKVVFDWISCEDNGSFSAFQCNPNNGRCFCLHPDGTRTSKRTFRENKVSEDICTQMSTCSELTCQRVCGEYKEDSNGCKTCECEEEREDCPGADELATQCSRNCMKKDDDNKDCLECRENCSDDDDDECDEDGCPMGGMCVARGSYASRRCLMSEREDGEMCEREEDESIQGINARRLLRGIASRRNVRNFRPVRTPCKNSSVCVPYNGTRGVCQRMDDIDGSCFDDSNGLECDSSGMFLPVQCSDDSCWCVDPENGTEIPNTRVDRHRARMLPDCFDLAYESCIIVVRGSRYRVEHNRFGLDVSNCRRCICQNGKLNDSTCVNGRSCIFITPGGGPQDCNVDGVQYKHGDVFKVDECNRCKCLNGRISGCTRRKCRNDDDDTPCGRCRKMPYDPVCGPNGVTYYNLCTAQYCAGLDPLEITSGPCSTQDPCENFPCEEGLTCMPKKMTCTTRRGCSPDQYRMCINDTDIDCPVDDEEEEVCGSDGKTYSSVCRMLIESDDVYAIYDGPCNQTECTDAPVCGTDFVTYPSICVLRTQSSNVRADYEGSCEEPSGEETLDTFCERVRSTRCRDLTECANIVQPTDGCCPICGGVVSIAIDEEGLAEYAELFEEVQSLDGLLEHIVGSGIIADATINNCELSAYITSTGNLEFIFEAIDVADSEICSMAAEDFSESINQQGDGTTSEITPDPVVSFLTAGSSLEQEEGGATTTSPGDSGTSQILPPTLLLFSIITGIFFA